MFCDLKLISFRAEADDGASDGVSTDNNDDTSVFVIDDVLDDVSVKVVNAADDGDKGSCESNDAVFTANVVVSNDDTAFVCDIRVPRMKNIVIMFLYVKL